MTTSFIREATSTLESIELDLKGFSFNQAIEFINSSFEDEREIAEMIRITLVVGAGKEKRQKYDEELQKWITQSLRGLGYREDHGSIAEFECQNTFKFQHDTGKNLKYVHVFPKAVKKEIEPENQSIADNSERKPDNLTKEEWICLISPQDVFIKLIGVKIRTWTQLSRCKNLFSKINDQFLAIEQKLVKMKALDDNEDLIYSECIDIAEKTSSVTKQMKKLVEDGDLLETEKAALIEKVKGKLPKTAKRLEAIEKIEPKALLELVRFKESKQLKKLLRESLNLKFVETKAGSKGLWSTKLSTKEIQLLKHKMACDEEFEAIIENEHCFFETEEEFELRRSKLINSVKDSLKLKHKVKEELGDNGGWGTIPSKKKKVDFSKGLRRKPNTGAYNVLMD